MGGDGGSPGAVISRGHGIVEQSLPVGDQTPVLHGTRGKVWDRYVVCVLTQKTRKPEQFKMPGGTNHETWLSRSVKLRGGHTLSSDNRLSIHQPEKKKQPP